MKKNVSTNYINELKDYADRLKAAYDIIEKSEIVVFEWSIGPGIPVKFVTENISKYGYTSEEFYSGKVDYWDFLHKDDVDYTRSAVYKKRESKISEYKHTYKVVCKDGTIRWVEEWTNWERDKNGNPITEKGIIRDITEQVETAEKLRKSEQRYRDLFENACALICTFNQNGEFTTVNRECSMLTGFSQNELLDMNIFSILHPIHLESYNKKGNLLQIIKGIENKSIEVTIRNKQGIQIVLEGKLLIINDDYNSAEIQGVFQDVTSKKEAEKRIYYLSYHDKLTDLYNRAYFDEKLDELDAQGKFPYCLIMGDINGLKKTNDLYGHKAGDKLLQIVANILKKSCRESDIVARIGGDEFAIILPKCKIDLARKIITRIENLCDSYNSNYPITPKIALGCSIKKDHSKSNDILISEADREMYRAKNNPNK